MPMNWKTKILSERIRNSAVLGGVLAVIYLIGHEIAVASGWLHAAGHPWRAYLFGVVGLLLLIAFAVFNYGYIYRVFRRLETIQEDFSDNLVADAIFNTEYSLSPANHRAVKKLESMINQREMMELSVQQSRYLALQNQINPHFLYNTLDAIRSDALIAGEVRIADTIEALSTFFAYTISNMDQLATLDEELGHVRDYFYIQKYRFEERLNLEIEDWGDVDDPSQLYVPRLTLQPLVENAIYHGLEGRDKCGTVTISLEQTSEHLILHVIDDGLGMEPEMLKQINARMRNVFAEQTRSGKKQGGIALENVNSRIQLLFGEEYGIRLYSVKNCGTDVRVLLPKVTKDNINEKRIPENRKRD